MESMNDRFQKAGYSQALKEEIDPLPRRSLLGSEDEAFSFECNLGLEYDNAKDHLASAN